MKNRLFTLMLCAIDFKIVISEEKDIFKCHNHMSIGEEKNWNVTAWLVVLQTYYEMEDSFRGKDMK